MTQDPTHSALHPGAETDVILVAAGRGERLGAESPKARVLLGGVPLFQHSLRLLCGHPGIARVFVVVPPDPGEMSTMDSLIGSAFEGTACPPLCVVPEMSTSATGPLPSSTSTVMSSTGTLAT